MSLRGEREMCIESVILPCWRRQRTLSSAGLSQADRTAAGSNFPAAEIARRESQLITDGVADCRLICELISAVQRGAVTYCYLAPVRELVEASARAQVSLVWEGGHIL